MAQRTENSAVVQYFLQASRKCQCYKSKLYTCLQVRGHPGLRLVLLSYTQEPRDRADSVGKHV